MRGVYAHAMRCVYADADARRAHVDGKDLLTIDDLAHVTFNACPKLRAR